MFRSRLARKIRAVFVLGFIFAALAFAAYWVEVIHPVHNFLSFYYGVSHSVQAMIDSAHNGS